MTTRPTGVSPREARPASYGREAHRDRGRTRSATTVRSSGATRTCRKYAGSRRGSPSGPQVLGQVNDALAAVVERQTERVVGERLDSGDGDHKADARQRVDPDQLFVARARSQLARSSALCYRRIRGRA
jgi:hypothetical protein